MTEERIQKLNDLGFEWSRNHPRQLTNLLTMTSLGDSTVDPTPEPVVQDDISKERDQLLFI
jgi:hypothetical protein